MDIDLIFKIAGIGILVAILNTLLAKAGRDEYVMLVTLAAITVVTFMLIDDVKELFLSLKELFLI